MNAVNELASSVIDLIQKLRSDEAILPVVTPSGDMLRMEDSSLTSGVAGNADDSCQFKMSKCFSNFEKEISDLAFFPSGCPVSPLRPHGHSVMGRAVI